MKTFLCCVTLALVPALASGFTATTFNAVSRPTWSRTSLYAAEDEATENEAVLAKEELPPQPPVKCPDCDLCDGSGRIEGGIGIILKWWPIKAYRPCPNFIERGGFYQRSGQGLDEIAFGRDSTFDVNN